MKSLTICGKISMNFEQEISPVSVSRWETEQLFDQEEETMKKRLLAWILVLMLAVTLLPTTALAEDVATSGNCGAKGSESDVTWKYGKRHPDHFRNGRYGGL